MIDWNDDIYTVRLANDQWRLMLPDAMSGHDLMAFYATELEAETAARALKVWGPLIASAAIKGDNSNDYYLGYDDGYDEGYEDGHSAGYAEALVPARRTEVSA